jgi:hypothetical protein
MPLTATAIATTPHGGDEHPARLVDPDLRPTGPSSSAGQQKPTVPESVVATYAATLAERALPLTAKQLDALGQIFQASLPVMIDKDRLATQQPLRRRQRQLELPLGLHGLVGACPGALHCREFGGDQRGR